MATKQLLQEVLDRWPEAESVTVETVKPGSRLMAMVVSNSFAGQNEAERQARVWSYVCSQIPSEDDLRNIEFIFTNTPNEERESRTAE